MDAVDETRGIYLLLLREKIIHALLYIHTYEVQITQVDSTSHLLFAPLRSLVLRPFEHVGFEAGVKVKYLYWSAQWDIGWFDLTRGFVNDTECTPCAHTSIKHDEHRRGSDLSILLNMRSLDG